jgi:hypothetical protein
MTGMAGMAADYPARKLDSHPLENDANCSDADMRARMKRPPLQPSWRSFFVLCGVIGPAQCVPWTLQNAIPTARTELSAAIMPELASPFVLAIGGAPRNPPGILSRVERYYYTTDTWTTGRSMPTARQSAGAHYVSAGLVYVIGGANTSTDEKANEQYNLLTDSWTSRVSIPSSSRERPGYAKLGDAKSDVILCVGGNGTRSAAATVCTRTAYM